MSASKAFDAARRFNATVSAEGRAWFWPTVAAAPVSRHRWLVVVCDSCGTVVDLDLRVKPCATCGAHDAMGTGGQGLSRWRRTHQFNEG